MTTLDAALSGTFAIGGDLTVNRLGFGAMRITGRGIWGPPENPEEARATLRRLPDLNVDFVDTAESYGPYVSEELIGEVLAPYSKGTVIATKSGLTRTGPDQWHQLGRPEFLRQGAIQSLRRLKLEVIDPWGRVVAELDHDRPGVLLAEIAPELVVEARQRIPALANARNFALPGALQR